MNESQPLQAPAGAERWQALDTHALERLPLRSRWFVILFIFAGIAHVMLTLYLAGQWTWTAAREAVSAILVCTFILLYLQFIKRASIKALMQLRGVITLPEDKYQRVARLILHANPRIELALLGVSIAIIYAVWRSEYHAPGSVLGWLATGYINLFGVLALWILLALVYNGLRSSWALRALAQSPLLVNAFDPTTLLPFGRLAVLHSLATIVVVSIPLLIMGLPTGVGGYFVLALSLFSLGVLVVPLWGVHRQIVRAREKVLDTVGDELMLIQTRLLALTAGSAPEMAELHQEAERLAGLRKLVLSGPSWPFRDYGTVARILSAVFLPTVVAFLTIFIQQVIWPMLRPSGIKP